MSGRPRGGHIVLVGLPGAGKSTVGPALAQRLGLPFVDLDREIERMAGLAVPQIFLERGEPAFRELERRATEGLGDAPSAVVAAGGGWIANPGAPALLPAGSRIIYLRITPAAALRRLGAAVRERPLLAGRDPLGTLERLLEERGPLYLKMSDHVIDVEHVEIQQLVHFLAELAQSGGDR